MNSRLWGIFASLLFFSVACSDVGPETEDNSSSGGNSGIGAGCGLGQLACSGVCTSVDSVSSCGSCGTSCGTGQSCTSGSCQCSGSLSACGAACVDISANAQNCGACGTACTADQLCSVGACIPLAEGCPDGFSPCDGACVDVTSDVFNCGVCGTSCSAGQVCQTGFCGCVSGELCGGACTNTLTDVQNCGGCGTACEVGQTCDSGFCVGGPQGSGGSSSGGSGNTDENTTSVGQWCFESATNGWGPVERDQSNGESASNDGATMTIAGVTYDHGLGVHAASDVELALDGACSTFTASVGIDDETPGSGSAIFQVIGDGTVLYESPLKSADQAATAVNVDVSGVTTLNLVVTDGGNGTGYDHANWAAASLTCSSSVTPSCGPMGTGGAGSGGAGSGGASSGGASSGGASSGGSSSGGSSQGSDLADEWPCNGSTAGYDAVVAGSGTYTVNGSGSYTYEAALVAALGSGGPSPSDKRTVLVQASGNVSWESQIRIRSNTVLNVCGTINVTNNVGTTSDRSPAYARDASDIDIPHFNLTGSAQYGMFFRNVSNLHLGDIHINGTGGIGIRIDSRQSNGSFDQTKSRNITIDYAHVQNTGGQGVETYGVDGIEIGTVYARNTGESGLLLNYSINANIDLVDAVDAGGGTGYAAFRVANDNGKYPNGTYPINIRLKTLLASGSDSGRGFFCVTRSGGLEIENFTINNVSGEPALFIENCYNIVMATGSGTLISGNAHLGHNSGNGDASRDITLQNISLQSGSTVTSVSQTCGRNNKAVNVTGGSVNVCQ